MRAIPIWRRFCPQAIAVRASFDMRKPAKTIVPNNAMTPTVTTKSRRLNALLPRLAKAMNTPAIYGVESAKTSALLFRSNRAPITLSSRVRGEGKGDEDAPIRPDAKKQAANARSIWDSSSRHCRLGGHDGTGHVCEGFTDKGFEALLVVHKSEGSLLTGLDHFYASLCQA